MTTTAQKTHQEHGRERAGALRYLVACLVGLLGCVGLTAPLSADLRPIVGQWAMIAVYAVYGALLTRTDLQSKRLPDALTLSLASALAGAAIGLAITTGNVMAAVISIALGFGLAIMLILMGATGQIGFGDVKLALGIGLLTGWHAWYLPLLAIALAYVLALPHAIIGVALRTRGRATADLPFGPYLIAAGMILAIAAAVLGTVAQAKPGVKGIPEVLRYLLHASCTTFCTHHESIERRLSAPRHQPAGVNRVTFSLPRRHAYKSAGA